MQRSFLGATCVTKGDPKGIWGRQVWCPGLTGCWLPTLSRQGLPCRVLSSRDRRRTQAEAPAREAGARPVTLCEPSWNFCVCFSLGSHGSREGSFKLG